MGCKQILTVECPCPVGARPGTMIDVGVVPCRILSVEDIAEGEKVEMTSLHKFSQNVPANTIKTITDFASKIAENGWSDVTFQTPWGKVIVFPTESKQPAPLKPCLCPVCGKEIHHA